jgi:thiol-disulfide isomerase/thioredoxin
LLTLALFAVSFPAAATTVPDATSLVGQVACSQCWFEADRSQVAYGTPGDLSCAQRCSEAGVPPALAVRNADDGSFELFLLDGPPPQHATWLELTGRFVRVSGSASDERDKQTLRVASLELLDDTPWPPPTAADPVDPHDLSWTDLSGHRLSLEDLHGRVVVLNFWATWCAPCRKEMPDLVRVQNKYGLLGVQVLGASADPQDQADAVLGFARSRKLNFPVLLGATTDQMQALGLGVALPGTVVLDREGRVVERVRGVFERAALEAAVDRALHGSDHHGDHGARGGDDAHDEAAGHVHVASARGTDASLVPS